MRWTPTQVACLPSGFGGLLTGSPSCSAQRSLDQSRTLAGAVVQVDGSRRDAETSLSSTSRRTGPGVGGRGGACGLARVGPATTHVLRRSLFGRSQTKRHPIALSGAWAAVSALVLLATVPLALWHRLLSDVLISFHWSWC